MIVHNAAYVMVDYGIRIGDMLGQRDNEEYTFQWEFLGEIPTFFKNNLIYVYDTCIMYR